MIILNTVRRSKVKLVNDVDVNATTPDIVLNKSNDPWIRISLKCCI